MIATQVADGRVQRAVLQDATDLEWVIICTTTLTNGLLTGLYYLGYPNCGPSAPTSAAPMSYTS